MLEALQSLSVESWLVLCRMAPYLLFGFFVAGMLSVLLSPERVERHLGGRGLWPILKAAGFGVPLPLCSCGVIPVGASLRKHGASRGATTAFLLSTPQTGVDSIFVTFSLLGPVFAVFRPFAALVTGIIGGGLVAAAEPDKKEQVEKAEACDDDCCTGKQSQGRMHRVFHYGFVVLARDIAKPLLVGVALAGLISALVPKNFFAGALAEGPLAMLAMIGIGIPLYVCATASVPIAAALLGAGLSPGAALAFLIAGPATNAATVSTIWKVLGRRTTFIYLGTVALSAMGMGMLLNQVYALLDAPALSAINVHEHAPGLPGKVSAVVLLIVLAAALFPRRQPEPGRGMDEDAAATLSVTGMTCNHCVNSVRRALLECSGVESVEVDLRTGKVLVSGRAFKLDALLAAVRELGYDAGEG